MTVSTTRPRSPRSRERLLRGRGASVRRRRRGVRRQRERRRRADRRTPARGAPPRRRRRDVPRQGTRARPHRGVRRRVARARSSAACRSSASCDAPSTRGEFTVHYQPVIALETQRLAGFEALVRWEHPDRGPPHARRAFLDVAEETGHHRPDRRVRSLRGVPAVVTLARRAPRVGSLHHGDEPRRGRVARLRAARRTSHSCSPRRAPIPATSFRDLRARRWPTTPRPHARCSPSSARWGSCSPSTTSAPARRRCCTFVTSRSTR